MTSPAEFSAAPYPGLRAFLRQETDIFFGRQKHTDQLLEKLDQARFLAVVGSSGCGKSSLVRAGMIAALETGFMASAGARWRIAEIRPGTNPMVRLAEALFGPSALGPERANKPEGLAFLAATLRRGPLGLVEILRDTPIPDRTNLLILVDQFEEIFRYHDAVVADEEISDSSQIEVRANPDEAKAEADAFVALLLASKNQRDFRIYVVITMRSDFLGECSRFPGLPEAINESQFLTPRLSYDQCVEAIVKPARVFGGSVEPALANRLLADSSSDQDQLPLLQNALMRMWRHATQNRKRTDETADAAGPTLGIVDYETAGGLGMTLSQHVDEAFDELNPEQQRIAVLVFRALTERGVNRRDTRRPVKLGIIGEIAGVKPERIAEVVDVFRKPGRSFLAPEASMPLDANSILDISHESLIRHWEKLRGWVEAEAMSAETYRRLDQTANLWKDRRASLLTGVELDNVLSWLKRENPNATWAARYGASYRLALEFLGQSQAAQREEDERKYRQQSDDFQKRIRLRFASRVTFVSVIVALGAFALAAWNLVERRRANHQSDEAIKQANIAKKLSSSAVTLRRDAEKNLAKALMFKADLALATNLPLSAVALLAGAKAGNEDLDILGKYDSLRAPPVHFLRMIPQKDSVTAIVASPDGADLISGLSNGMISICKLATGEVSDVRSFHSKAITSLAFAPSGRLLVSASSDNEISIWKVDSGKIEEPVALPQPKLPECVAFAPSSDSFAAGFEDGTFGIWVKDGTGAWKQTVSPKLPSDNRNSQNEKTPLTALTFDPAGTYLVGVTNTTIQIWDAKTGHELTDRVGFGYSMSGTTCVAFYPNGQFLATGNQDGNVQVWALRQTFGPDAIHTPGSSYPGVSGGAELPPKAAPRVAKPEEEAAQTKRISLVRLTLGMPHPTEFGASVEMETNPTKTGSDKSPRSINSIAFTPNGDCIAWTSGNALYFWWWLSSSREVLASQVDNNGFFRTPDITNNPNLGASHYIRIQAHNDDISSIVIRPDGRLLASGSRDKTIRLWEIDTDEEIAWDKTQGISKLAFSPDGKTLAAGTLSDSTLRVWDLETGEETRLIGHTKDVLSVAFSRLNLLASGSRDGTVKLWAPGNLTPIETLPADGDVFGLAFSPDGNTLAVGTTGNTIKLWNVKEFGHAKQIGFLLGHEKTVFSLCFSKTGAFLASASFDGTARIWNTTDLTIIKSYQPSSARRLCSIAISPDERVLAAGSSEGSIQFWDVGAGVTKQEIKVGNESIYGLVFSPNGTELASGADHGNINLWDTATGAKRKAITSPTRTVIGLAYDPSGSTLASSGEGDGIIHFWDKSGKLSRDLGGNIWLQNALLKPENFSGLRLKGFEVQPIEPSEEEHSGGPLDANDDARASYWRALWECRKRINHAEIGEGGMTKVKFDAAMQPLSDWKKEHSEPASVIKAFNEELDALRKRAADLFTEKGEDLLQQGRFDAALEPFRTAVEINPDDAPAYFSLGYAYHKNDKMPSREAEAEANKNQAKAIELDRSVGEKYGRFSFGPKQLLHLSEAIWLQPTNYDFRRSRAEIYLKQKQWDEALEDYDVALKLHPTDASLASVLYGLARAYGGRAAVHSEKQERNADVRKALDNLEQAVRKGWPRESIRPDDFSVLKDEPRFKATLMPVAD